MNISDRTINALQQNQSYYEQSENSVLSYTVNWAAVLGSGTISTSTWTAEGATLAGAANTTTTATVKISGSPGGYMAINKIVTAGGETMERIIKVKICDNGEGWEVNDYA